jgi:hypothetical protein
MRMHNSVKNAFIILLSVFILSSFSGCSFMGFFNSQSYMSPPKSSSDQQAIYALMKDSEGNVSFIYPKSGSNRSAIIMDDFTGNGTIDAVCFTSDTSTGNTKVLFLSNDNGKWSMISSFTNKASQVDRVILADLNNDGKDEVLIGWGSTQSLTATLNIYCYSDSTVSEYPLETTYGEVCVDDFTESGYKQIMIFSTYTAADGSTEKATDATAKVYDFSSGNPEIKYTTAISNSVTRYVSAQYLKINMDTHAIVLTGAEADGSYMSQILCYDKSNDTWQTPLSWDDISKKYNYFTCPPELTLTAKDINSDGITEFPSISLQPGVAEDTTADSTNYYVIWTVFYPSASTSESVLTSIYNMTDNYYVNLPSGIDEKITTAYDSSTREMTFSYTETGEQNRIIYSNRLFIIKAFTKSAWEKESSKETTYKQLTTSQTDLVYAVRIISSDKYNDAILNSLSLITE